jgi:APA family basic amino acid/polyamine antiporter
MLNIKIAPGSSSSIYNLEGSNKSVFARQATGLVRELSITDTFFANLSFINIALGVLTYTSAPFIFPGSNPVVATFLATGLSIFISVMYMLFMWAMPRTGGDYVWVSRILNPIVGFVANFNVTFWYIFFIGIAANWVTTLALAPTLLTIGTVTGNQGLISLAATISHPLNVTIIGIVTILIITGIMLAGTRPTFTVNNILFLISIVGVVVLLGLLITNTNASFVSNFNKFANYNNVTATAHAHGYSPTGSNDFVATLGVMPFIFASTGYGIISSYFAGEVKSVRKNAFYSQVIATAVGGILLGVIGALAISVFGYDFLGSITFLGSTGSSAYPFSFPVYLDFLVSMLTTNQAVLWILGIGFVAAILISFLPTYMVATRNIFAWSFDRVLPTKFATVSERFRTATYAVILVAVLQLVGLISYTYGPPFFFSLVSGAGLAEILTFIVVAIASIVFPFKLKEIYKNSPANRNIGGIPVISIVGVVSLAFYLLLEYFYFTNPLYGANVPVVFEAVGISIGLPILIFVISYFQRKSRGLNLTLAFKEIPPE